MTRYNAVPQVWEFIVPTIQVRGTINVVIGVPCEAMAVLVRAKMSSEVVSALVGPEQLVVFHARSRYEQGKMLRLIVCTSLGSTSEESQKRLLLVELAGNRKT